MSARNCAVWLWALLGLFSLRVLAQLVQLRFDLPFLPPFAAWQSGVLSYRLLFGAQLAIVLLLGWIAVGVTGGRIVPSIRRARFWLAAGSLYVAVMLARLVLGLTLLDGHGWFDRPLPTAFHLVLACFLLVVGAYHRTDRGLAEAVRK